MPTTEIERHTSSALFAPPGYSHAVVSRARATVWTAGGVPLDADGALVGRGDMTAQAEQVLANLTVALADAGAARSRVDRRPHDLLGYERQLVEIEATAVV